jgi:hypothetical protein
MKVRGVMLFEGKLNEDELSGSTQFVGITLDNPPPPLNFSFKKNMNGKNILQAKLTPK